MDMDKVIKFIAARGKFILFLSLILWAFANACVKFMPEYATQLPLPVYEFFYSITMNIEPSLPTETIPLEPIEPDS